MLRPGDFCKWLVCQPDGKRPLYFKFVGCLRVDDLRLERGMRLDYVFEPLFGEGEHIYVTHNLANVLSPLDPGEIAIMEQTRRGASVPHKPAPPVGPQAQKVKWGIDWPDNEKDMLVAYDAWKKAAWT